MIQGRTTRILKRAAIGLILAAVLVFIDQYTKYLALRFLKPVCNIPLIAGVLELQYLENHGAAFGMFQNRQWLFVIFAFGVIIGAMAIYMRTPPSRKFAPLRICLTILVAGSVGNLMDRMERGFVIDFIYVSLINFPIFNIADIFVSVSVTILAVLILFYYSDDLL